MTPTTIRDRAAQLAHLGLQYIGPGPCAASTWAYDERGRAIVIDKTGAEISPTTPGTRGRTVARSAELIEAARTAGHLISYAGGNRPAEVCTTLPEHLHACRARHDRLSDNLGDELHPAGECTTRVPFDPAAPTSVDHVKATPERPLAVVGAPAAASAPKTITASYAGTCGICWTDYRAGDSIVLAHRSAFASVHPTCAERADRTPNLPAHYVHAAAE